MSVSMRRTKTGIEFSMTVDAMTATWFIAADATSDEITGAMRSLLAFHDQHTDPTPGRLEKMLREAEARTERNISDLAAKQADRRTAFGPPPIPDGASYELIPAEEMNGWKAS